MANEVVFNGPVSNTADGYHRRYFEISGLAGSITFSFDDVLPGRQFYLNIERQVIGDEKETVEVSCDTVAPLTDMMRDDQEARWLIKTAFGFDE